MIDKSGEKIACEAIFKLVKQQTEALSKQQEPEFTFRSLNGEDDSAEQICPKVDKMKVFRRDISPEIIKRLLSWCSAFDSNTSADS